MKCRKRFHIQHLKEIQELLKPQELHFECYSNEEISLEGWMWWWRCSYEGHMSVICHINIS